MNVVIINAGSSSMKVALFQMPESQRLPAVLDPIWKVSFSESDPDQPGGQLRIRAQQNGGARDLGTIEAGSDSGTRLRRLLALLWGADGAPLGDPDEIHVVGHRVVHGGGRYREAVEVDAEVEGSIRYFAKLAPLHNPTNLVGIEVAREVCGNGACAQFAVFDTAFHHTLPRAAFVYPGPREWLDRGIRRFGFHGTSFRWSSRHAASLMGREGDPDLRLIICHLGGGCSLCATVGGRSIDTTMGFTPLDGVAMATRPGALDPGLLLHLLREGMPLEQLESQLNHHCGLAGLAGTVGDSRVILPKARSGNADAQLALEVFFHRLRAGIGQMLASLGQLPDAIVFTDAIGESTPEVRSEACEFFSSFGLVIDHQKNAASPSDADIATADSAIRALIIHGREEWQIAQDCHQKFIGSKIPDCIATANDEI